MELYDGSYHELTVSQIAEATFSQIDAEGHHFHLLSKITDHKPNVSAISISDGFINSSNGNHVTKKTTYIWKLQVEWKDGSKSWVPLKDLKASYPIELSEYEINKKIERKPAFHLWVGGVAKKRYHIIGKVAKKY